MWISDGIILSSLPHFLFWTFSCIMNESFRQRDFPEDCKTFPRTDLQVNQIALHDPVIYSFKDNGETVLKDSNLFSPTPMAYSSEDLDPGHGNNGSITKIGKFYESLWRLWWTPFWTFIWAMLLIELTIISFLIYYMTKTSDLNFRFGDKFLCVTA